ncbi:MAG: response regulator [Planctomycetota bacterium]
MSAETAPNKPLQILALAKALHGSGLQAALEQQGEVRIADSIDEALAALRARLFDIVLGAPTDLFPLARAEARQRAELILDRLGQCICIVNHQGELVWANSCLQSYPQVVRETVQRNCTELCQELVTSRSRPEAVQARRRIISVEQDYVFDLTVSPLLSSAGQINEVVGLALDTTSAARLQEKINTIDAAGRQLMRLDADAVAQLDVYERLELLEENIIRFAHDLLHFDHFVVCVLDQQTNKLQIIIATGLPEEIKSIDIYATPEGNGISGYVAATGRSYICPDVSRDPRYLPGLERAGSSLTVPLRLHDQVVGVFNVESHQVAAFTEDDRQFAEIFGRYMAIALNILQLLVVERSTATGQIATDVVSGAGVPLNDIVAEATRTINDYAEDTDLCHRLHNIITDVDRVKQNIQAMTRTQGVRGLVPETNTCDPLLAGKRILVADDEEIIRETVAEVLGKTGALIVMARDGQEAVSMIRAQHFDLVISDIKMPYKNGYEVFAAVKQSNIHCPVILITGFGYDPDHSIVRASREGLAGVLFKPFKIDQLVDDIHHALSPPAN